MKVIEKGADGAEPVHMPFDAAQAALASGAFDAHPIEGERGPDQPAAQSPAPGTDPVGGKEEARDGEVLTNLTPIGVVAAPPAGLPREPAPPAEKVVEAPVVEPPLVKVIDAPQPAKAAPTSQAAPAPPPALAKA